MGAVCNGQTDYVDFHPSLLANYLRNSYQIVPCML